MSQRSEIPRAELLQRVLTGELSPRDTSVLAARESDPEFAAELDECLAMQDLLDTDAKEERAAINPPGPRPSRRWPLTLVAAAFLALLVIPRAYKHFAGVGDPGAGAGAGAGSDIMLGSELSIEALSPVGDGQSFHEFSFRANLPEGSRCELRIFAADSAPGAAALFTKRFSGNLCSLTDDEERSLPDTILSEVRVFDLAGEPLAASSRVLASR